MPETLSDRQTSQPAPSGRGSPRGFRSRCVRGRIPNGLRAVPAAAGVWSRAWGRGAVLRPPPLPATSPASLRPGRPRSSSPPVRFPIPLHSGPSLPSEPSSGTPSAKPAVPLSPAATRGPLGRAMSLHGKRKEIYKYEAPWTVYAMNWSVRPDKRFRLALGSFVEEYNNKVGSGGGRARLCRHRAAGLGQSEGEEGADPLHPSGSSGPPVLGTAPRSRARPPRLVWLDGVFLPCPRHWELCRAFRGFPEVQGAGLDSGWFPSCGSLGCWETEGLGVGRAMGAAAGCSSARKVP